MAQNVPFSHLYCGKLPKPVHDQRTGTLPLLAASGVTAAVTGVWCDGFSRAAVEWWQKRPLL